MKIIPLWEKLEKICFRNSGDVIRLQEDGSGPWVVVSATDSQMTAKGSSGLYEYQIKDIYLVHLETGVRRQVSLSARATYYPNAELHMGAPQ